MGKIQVALLSFIGSILLVSYTFGGEVEDAILKGNQWVQKKDYPKAIKEYENALSMDPKNSKACLLLGLTYANTGALDKAVLYSQKAIDLEPSYNAYHNLGLIYGNQGDYEKAVAAYEKALQLNPSSFRAWYQLGLLHAGNNQFDRAIGAYKKVLELNPQFTDAHLGLGSAYYWAGNKAAALEEVNELRSGNKKQEAQALEEWVNAKESRKKEVVSKSAVKESPASA